MKKSKAIFLDRDGVINYDRNDFIRNLDEYKLIDKSIESIVYLNNNLGYKIFIISNQSGIGRGIIKTNNLNEITNYLINNIKEGGGNITEIKYCFHTSHLNCWCRKPNPGNVLKMKRKYKLDLSKSFIIGDRYTDILCGMNSGIMNTILIKNKSLPDQLALNKNIKVDFSCDYLHECINYIENRSF